MRPWQIILVIVGVIVILLMVFVWPSVRTIDRMNRELQRYPSEIEARTALNQNPNDAMAHYTLATEAALRFDQKNRLAEIETACRLEPENNAYKLELGSALLYSKRQAEASAIFEQLVKVDGPIGEQARAMQSDLVKRQKAGSSRPSSNPIPR